MKNYIEVSYNYEDYPLTNYPSKLVDFLISKFKINKNAKVLELGCGRGEHLKEFIQRKIDIIGVDKFEDALKMNDKEFFKKVDVEKENLPFGNDTFDFIISKSFIEHFNYPEFFGEVHRVLKKNGKVISMTPDWEHCFKTFYDDVTHIRPFTSNSLKELHLAFGFNEIKIEKFKQLPILWNKNILINLVFNYLSEITRIFIPERYRKTNKWIRFSKEIMLISSAKK